MCAGTVFMGQASHFHSPCAVDRDRKGVADLAHAIVTQAAETVHQDRQRDAFDRVQVDRGPAGHRVVAGFENDLADQTPDRRRTRRNQCSTMTGYHGIAGEHHDRPPTDLGHLAPPELTAGG